MSTCGVLNRGILQIKTLRNRLNLLPFHRGGKWWSRLCIFFPLTLNLPSSPNMSIPWLMVLVDLPCFPTYPTTLIHWMYLLLNICHYSGIK